MYVDFKVFKPSYKLIVSMGGDLIDPARVTSTFSLDFVSYKQLEDALPSMQSNPTVRSILIEQFFERR